jgi:hypothetical protein
MLWNLHELTEDAIVAYLRTVLPGSMVVYTGLDKDRNEYPCVTVQTMGSEPISETAEWHDPRKLTVMARVETELAEVDGKSPRAIHATAFSVVADALCTSALLAHLIEQGIDGIAFSMAQAGAFTREAEGMNVSTTIELEVIAEPVTGS